MRGKLYRPSTHQLSDTIKFLKCIIRFCFSHAKSKTELGVRKATSVSIDVQKSFKGLGKFSQIFEDLIRIALMRVFPKAIVFTTKSHFDVRRTYASIRGLVVTTIGLAKTRISAISFS